MEPKPLDSLAPDIFSEQGYEQIIDIPTRVTGKTISLIDLIFVSNTDNINCHGPLPEIADHEGIFISFHCVQQKVKPITKTIFDYKNANEKGLFKYLGFLDYQPLVFSKPVSEQAEAYSSILIEAQNQFLPTRQIWVRPKDQDWCNTYTRLLIRSKKRNYQFF